MNDTTNNGYEIPTDLRGAATAARDQFAFYAAEHRKAGKMEKSAVNQRFANLLTAALSVVPTPTNDAPVTVEQCDIDRAARCFTIEGRDGDRLREHFADQFARHRLAALASAPAAFTAFEPTEAMWQAAWDASEDYFISDKVTVQGFRIAIRAMLTAASAPAGDGVATRLKYDAPQGTGQFEVFDPEPDNHHSALYLVDPNGAAFNVSCWDEVGLDIARAEWMRDTLNAALARPRAAAGEQAIMDAINSRKAIYETKRDEADPLADDDCNRHERMTHTVEAFDMLLGEIAALQSPPAKETE